MQCTVSVFSLLSKERIGRRKAVVYLKAILDSRRERCFNEFGTRVLKAGLGNHARHWPRVISSS